MRFFPRFRRRKVMEIAPDEVLMDSRNLPDFDTSRLEGRLEKPISRLALYGTAGIFTVIMLVFFVQAWKLQIVRGQEYRTRSENNMLRPVPVFAGRGVIYDRTGKLLAWNAPASIPTVGDVADVQPVAEDIVSDREYATTTGLAHVIGYVQYPSKDS